MPADPQYDAVSALAKPASPYYGCHNKPRPQGGARVQISDCYRTSTVPEDWSYEFRHSTECRYDQSQKDSRCSGCVNINPAVN